MASIKSARPTHTPTPTYLPTLTTHLQYMCEQISEIPCHSSNGGNGRVPSGRMGLYTSFSALYICGCSKLARNNISRCEMCSLNRGWGMTRWGPRGGGRGPRGGGRGPQKGLEIRRAARYTRGVLYGGYAALYVFVF